MLAADWAIFGLFGFLAFLTRFMYLNRLSDAGTPIFDEKHYVPQAWQILRSTDNALVGGIEDNPGFGLVVHPPLSKQIMAVGEFFFGYTPLGWRFMAALAGIAVVLLVMAIVRRLTHDRWATFAAGVLAIGEGVLLTSSRVGMLDIFLTAFVVLAAYFLIVDRDDVHRRMHSAYLAGRVSVSSLGPRFGVRWWRFGAGIALGLALGVKWSGLYFIAAFGLLTFGFDWALRNRYGVKRPLLGTLLRDVPSAVASIVLVPAAIHLWLWRAWFASETGVYRHVAGTDTAPREGLSGLLPETLQSWVYYQNSVLGFHGSLTTSSGHKHPWESKPWQWLWSGRPMLYYNKETDGCGGTCHEALMLFGNPAVWWLLVPVMLLATWLWLVRLSRRWALPVVGFIASWAPWVVTYDRQMYFFYATAMIPFVIIALAMLLGKLRRAPSGALLYSIYLGAVTALFLFFLPLMVGLEVSQLGWELRMWLPSWQ